MSARRTGRSSIRAAAIPSPFGNCPIVENLLHTRCTQASAVSPIQSVSGLLAGVTNSVGNRRKSNSETITWMLLRSGVTAHPRDVIGPAGRSCGLPDDGEGGRSRIRGRSNTLFSRSGRGQGQAPDPTRDSGGCLAGPWSSGARASYRSPAKGLASPMRLSDWWTGGRPTSPEGCPGYGSTTSGAQKKVEASRAASCYTHRLSPAQNARPLASPGEARAGQRVRDPHREVATTSRWDLRAFRCRR
jgi:hypothetical protein